MRHNVLFDPRGLDAIEDFECREWLRLNGASLRALQAPYIRGLYDLSMGYEDGDLNRPRLSAGQGVRGSLRTFFGYRGAFMWRMRAGMGDVVFAPLYEALKRRGVGFEFFHRLTNVGLPPPRPEGSAARDWVQSLTFDIQARTRDGAAYAPLVEVAGRPCWPSQPDFGQLRDEPRGAWRRRAVLSRSHWDRRRAGEMTLEVGKDFDFVVLGVGLGVIPHICPEILARDERWRRMTQEVKTVASQAFQVWLTEDLETLGWQGPASIAGAFAKPFDTWCDMAHVVPEEAWAWCARRPRSTFFAPSFPILRRRRATMTWAIPGGAPTRCARTPSTSSRARSVRPGPRLSAPTDSSAGTSSQPPIRTPGRGPEDSPPNTGGPTSIRRTAMCSTPLEASRHWISPLDMTYDNLTIAGDWTDSGFHSGCVEGAVMSGLLAAHALCGAPRLEDIVGYDHP